MENQPQSRPKHLDLSWFNPSQQLSTMQPLPSPPSQWITSARIFGRNLATAWTLSLPCMLRRSGAGGMWAVSGVLTPT